MLENSMDHENTINEAKQIKSSLDLIKEYATELETIKEDIRSKRLAVTQISTNAQTKEAEIINIHTKIIQLEEKASDYLSKIEAENIKLTEYFASFDSIRTKLDSEDDGLEATFVWAQQQKEEIGKLLGQSRLDEAAITEMKKISANNTDAIANHKKDVEGYRKEIEKIYGFINGQGLAHSFSERQKQLKWPLIIWSFMLFISTCLVSWALYEVFKELPIDATTGKRIFDPSSLFYRTSFISPIILIFFVALRQYSRERRLLESYAFKAATAKALESYTAILARGFPEEKFRHRILAFVLHAMIGIYRHPNNELSKIDEENNPSDYFSEMFDKVAAPVVNTIKKATSSIVSKDKN